MKNHILTIGFVIFSGAIVQAETHKVSSIIEFRALSGQLQPGDVVELVEGDYDGSIHLVGLSGKAGKPITIQGANPKDRPVISGGRVGIHLSKCSHVRIRNLIVKGASINGINADDGGSANAPASHLEIENVDILETGPRGNLDALKLSGVDHFLVRKCRFSGWGGQGIDVVGCHHGEIDSCRFEGRAGFSQTTGVQCKGGSSDILIHRCQFVNAGQRGVNIGGSTGLAYFRPPGVKFEAKDIEVAGNVFVGGLAPVIFVSSIGGSVHHNTIVTPDKWVVRILQEADPNQFENCRDGVFEQNLVVFDSNVRTFVNVGPNTKPETFRFTQNAWFDRSGNRVPQLPSREEGGLYGIDPQLSVEDGNLVVRSRDDRLQNVGAHAYKPSTQKTER